MNSTNFMDVINFQQKILGHPGSKKPMLPDPLIGTQQVDFLLEEVQELSQAVHEGDIVAFSDALADIVYVALGIAYQQGIPFDDIWDVVQKANMKKVRGMTKRGQTYDAMKPIGWVAPEGQILKILSGK
jgi:predicted HAD superfamily Cof-like phosphohydrolase